MNKEVNALKMAQKKEDKEQTQLQKIKEADEKRAAKAEEKMAKKVAEQVKKDLKEQLKRPPRKDSPILIQEEVMVVAKSAIEAKEAVVRIMQSKSCRYGDERTLIVRSHMGERAVYYIGACTSRAYKPR